MSGSSFHFAREQKNEPGGRFEGHWLQRLKVSNSGVSPEKRLQTARKLLNTWDV
jgi:hypothetical protein